jgi:hypothetical protein
MMFRGLSFTIGDIAIRMDCLVLARNFLRVMKIEDASDGTDTAPAPQAPVMTIDLGPRCRVAIPSGFDMEAAAHLLNGLMVRS